MGDASSPRVWSGTNSSPSVIPIRVLTHNIRYAATDLDESERPWSERLPHLSSHFKYHTREHFTPKATIVCMQEVLHSQLHDLRRATFEEDNDWTYVGVARDDGKTQGEYSPIFFRKSAWNCVHFETIWLNETGAVGKKGWDAGSVRILTCAILAAVTSSEQTSTTNTNKVILAMNTHLDNAGPISRRESAKIIISVSAQLRDRYDPFFTFLAGDLNSPPDDDAYKILNTPGSGFFSAGNLPRDEDARVYVEQNTFTGFPADPGAKGTELIDFVHLGTTPKAPVEQLAEEIQRLVEMVKGYGVLPNRFDDGVWMSDHRAVVVDLLVPH